MSIKDRVYGVKAIPTLYERKTCLRLAPQQIDVKLSSTSKCVLFASLKLLSGSTGTYWKGGKVVFTPCSPCPPPGPHPRQQQAPEILWNNSAQNLIPPNHSQHLCWRLVLFLPLPLLLSLLGALLLLPLSCSSVLLGLLALLPDWRKRGSTSCHSQDDGDHDDGPQVKNDQSMSACSKNTGARVSLIIVILFTISVINDQDYRDTDHPWPWHWPRPWHEDGDDPY